MLRLPRPPENFKGVPPLQGRLVTRLPRQDAIGIPAENARHAKDTRRNQAANRRMIKLPRTPALYRLDDRIEHTEIEPRLQLMRQRQPSTD